MLVGIERAKRLAERLADAIAGVWPHRILHPDPPPPRIKADRVVRRGEHDALDPGPARRLEQIVAADDVGLQDRLPWALDRKAAEMHDAVDPLHDFLHRREVRKLGRHESLIRAEICRRAHIAHAQFWIDAFEELAQPRANATGGAG